MSKNRVIYVLVMLALAVAFIPVIVTQAAGNSNTIDSATRSYTAWARAVEEQKLAPKVDRSYDPIETERSTQIAAAGSGHAHRSYLGGVNVTSYGRAMPGFANLEQVDRSYDLIESERGGISNSDNLDSATRSYMAWAKAVEEQRLAASGGTIQSEGLTAGSVKADALNSQQSLQCPDNECTFQLPDGHTVK